MISVSLPEKSELDFYIYKHITKSGYLHHLWLSNSWNDFIFFDLLDSSQAQKTEKKKKTLIC